MKSIFKAFELIEEYEDDCDLLGTVSEEEVRKAENRLGLVFPDSFRLFVLKYGLGDIFSEEIYGVGIEPSGIPSTIWITELLRKEMELASNLLVIYNLGYNNQYYAIDCDEGDSHGEVYSFVEGIPYEKQELKLEFDSFADFLLNLLEENTN
ncbi:SMI1/KNR4 family protein [Rossellomorea arthrocnemi]|uniref:SMI1/KNR4 family protein n=1 Tax=Rossellomorea arthrocnemi TaxID=2769542 RepID=UPI001917B6C1|nr:SMI1/KNR4 family protein [Rossellomorea arthrocnemi]